ncbi:MAG: hypothetical protein ACRD3W_22345, partial [Terriglobales bacterium]
MADLGQYIGRIARTLLGDPTHATKREMCYGTNYSLKIDLENGVWFDHEAKTGGGAMDLLRRQGINNGEISD